MGWFPNEDAIRTWGGPDFAFPFSPDTFRRDLHWPDMASFSLLSPANEFAAFGQAYERIGRINLARLVVNPELRGKGVGQRLVRMLMACAADLMPLAEFSLFVYRDNAAALQCYQSVGFEVNEYPHEHVLKEQCYYLTRPV